MRVFFLVFLCFISSQLFAAEQPLMEKIPVSQAIASPAVEQLSLRSYQSSLPDSMYRKKAKTPGDLLERAGRNYTIARIVSIASVTIYIIAMANAQSKTSSKAAQGNAILTLMGGEIAALVLNFIGSERLKQAGRALNAQELQKRMSY